ncbi:hypothetical protein TNCV_1276851 [Trichonephila clavipes]|nr:hypothetical protein TNCV_1276851 [Trichonephila clavipes]
MDITSRKRSKTIALNEHTSMTVRDIATLVGVGKASASRILSGFGTSIGAHVKLHNMLTKYQMIKFIDFCEVWFLPESVARLAAIVGDHLCHMPRHYSKRF